MLDFVKIVAETTSKGSIVIYPDFIAGRSNDLMIRGKAFYAVWDSEAGVWNTDEYYVERVVDEALRQYYTDLEISGTKKVKYMSNFSSKKWQEWQQYCKSLPDNYHELDKVIRFSNDKIHKRDYVTRKLDYPMEEGPMDSYEELVSTLYDPLERQKIEWAIGAVIAGDSKWIQKFLVLYGGPGTGKSTILNIIQGMFPGYYGLIDSKSLGSVNNAFAMESLRNNPLIAIQHDGDLSRIEDNTKLNSIISHEELIVNEKHKSIYTTKFCSFIFMGTNKPVRITDAKSGIIRRLIDVNPSGRKVSKSQYDKLMAKIPFEYGAIAYHCLQVYQNLGAAYYDGYIPTMMMSETNDMYNFIEDNYEFFVTDHPEYVTLNMAWLKYKEYCQDANVPYPFQRRVFGNELKNYFYEFYERKDGERSVYMGFKKDQFNVKVLEPEKVKVDPWLQLQNHPSLLDLELKDCKAQYSNKDGIPMSKWDNCNTILSDLDSRMEHYVRPPKNLIVIDFDLKNLKGEKDYGKNLKAASKWPETYAECSKSGAGIHLHYWYNGDVSLLSPLVDDNIEVKVFTGKSALRRRLSKCNQVPIATISSGLMLKEVKKRVLKDEVVKSEKALRSLIIRNLRKEIHPATKPSIDFIAKLLDDAYNSGMKYDVSDMRNDIQQFALNSSHNADYCLKVVGKMKFHSEEPSDNLEGNADAPIVFFDVEVFPNVFIVVWKKQGEGSIPVKMINPTASQVEELTKFRLIGFNNRDYDNHMLYACMMGYTPEQLFKLSQRIIVGKDQNAKFGEAYNLSYTDVYDFLSAGHKMSLKKWEIKLGIHHHEFPYRWDQPLPEDKWEECAEYCQDDVIATEAVFDHNKGDWLARKVLAKLSGLTVNDKTNNHTIKIIIGDDKDPWSQFVYTDLSTIFPEYEYSPYGIDKSRYNEGAKIVSGKSIYKGEDPGEGGRVESKPGFYTNVALLDIASMHPSSIEALNLFGDRYTKRFSDIKKARIYAKHKEYDKFATILDGKLAEFLNDPEALEGLPDALKTAINSAYGLTSATFPNKLKDPRNVDNIVAKRGALFMIDLSEAVKKQGFQVAHIKTDSIKIPDATPEIIEFVMDFGKKYGYDFEHEATYDRMCLVNESVYIAKYATEEKCQNLYGYVPGDNTKHGGEWTATGAQFKVPYVFKTLFSHEDLEFDDLCNTFAVTTNLYLDMNEGLPEGQNDYRFVGKVGSFCPILPGYGGGVLCREATSKTGEVKYDAPPGSKGYRWLESEIVKLNDGQNNIDYDYFGELCEDAKEAISKYIPFEVFVSEYVGAEEVPFKLIENDPNYGVELPFH